MSVYIFLFKTIGWYIDKTFWMAFIYFVTRVKKQEICGFFFLSFSLELWFLTTCQSYNTLYKIPKPCKLTKHTKKKYIFTNHYKASNTMLRTLSTRSVSGSAKGDSNPPTCTYNIKIYISFNFFTKHRCIK